MTPCAWTLRSTSWGGPGQNRQGLDSTPGKGMLRLSDPDGQESKSLRVLVIVAGPSTDRPSSGKLMRRHHLIRAAGRVASLEIFVMEKLDDQELDEMSSIYSARV